MVVKKSKDSRDAYLGILTALGLEMFVNRLFTLYFLLDKSPSLSFVRALPIIGFFLYALGAGLIYKKLEVSSAYKKYFLIIAIVVFISNLFVYLIPFFK